MSYLLDYFASFMGFLGIVVPVFLKAIAELERCQQYNAKDE